MLESTTYPGTTDTDLKGKSFCQNGVLGSKLDKIFTLAYSPERRGPRAVPDHSVQTIPKVMGGFTPDCLERCKELYLLALDQVHAVNSCRVAEATKLTENIFRAVNIAMVNELKVVFHKMGIDVWEVIQAAATEPCGISCRFYPGPGLGGHLRPN